MKAWILAAIVASSPLVGVAGGLTDAIMVPGLFAGTAEGEVLRYDHARRLPGLPEGATLPGADKGLAEPKAVVGGSVVISRAGDRLQLVLAEPEHEAHVAAEFSAKGPNPALLFFLENIVRTMAVQSGGSPFYIRNRIRDALATEDAPADGQVTLTPFAEDPNRARMGQFGDLEIVIAYDPADPSRLIELKADTGDGPAGYSESLRLISEE